MAADLRAERGVRRGPITGQAVRPASRQAILWAIGLFITGCGGDARVELAAADSMNAVGDAFALAVTEYHEETVRSDDARERGAVRAFAERVRRDADDEAKTEAHEEALLAALARIRADRAAEWERFRTSLDNVVVLREAAAGLRRLAVESLSLEDETRRYFQGVLERLNTAQPKTAEDKGN